MSKKKIWFCLLMFAAFFFCHATDAAEKEIRIALWKLPLNIPAMAAMDENAYEKAFSGDRKIDYIQLPSGPKQIQAMAAGALDISEGIGASAALVGIANGAKIKIIGVTSRSPKAFAVMVLDPAIKNAGDLKGKKVAGLRGSVVHELLLIYLAEAGLSENDIEFFPMTLHAAASALIGRRVDAALLVGTEVVKAQSAGAKILADGEGRLNGLSLIAARADFLEKNQPAVHKYLATREQIVERLRKNPDAFVPLVMNETGLSEVEAKKLMKLYDFDSQITSKDLEELRSTYLYLEKGNYIKKSVDADHLMKEAFGD